ncbi:MAG: preprotein translocase subunit SecG [Opitutaceae bacterium]|nr:preprotein translocase subunit SecG [Opitutaceae bacterium]
MSVLLGIGTFFLVLVSILMVLAILAQRTKSDGGVGAALGGGMAEAAFGAESGNILTKATTYLAVTFFVLSLGLYLGYIYNHRRAAEAAAGALPSSPALTAPAEPSSSDSSAAPAGPETTAPETPAAAPESVPAAPTANP